MGFGTLLIGHLLLLNIPYHFLTGAVAYLLILAGVWSLSPYGKGFARARLPLIPLIAVSGVGMALELIRMLGGTFPTSLVTPLAIAEHLLTLASMLCILDGIRTLSGEVGLHEIRLKAIRNTYFCVIYYAGCALMELPFPLPKKALSLISLTLVLFGFAYLLVNTLLIYSCYRKICLEGDEDMPRHRSRFALINRFHEELDRREETALKRTLDERQARKDAKDGKNKKSR